MWLSQRSQGVVALGSVLAVMFVPRAFGQEETASEILSRLAAKNLERQQALESYTADRVYRFTYTGIGGPKTAQIDVHAEYRASAGKRLTIVKESGSKALCDAVLKKLVEGEEEASQLENEKRSTISPANYHATLVGQEQVDGEAAWVLEVTPRVPSKFTYRGRIWVSQDDFAVMRVLGEPAKSPSVLVGHGQFDYRYRRIGRFWLPARNVSVSHVRLGGEARVTIDYTRYALSARANDGLVSMLR
jgi:hypothetical protein